MEETSFSLWGWCLFRLLLTVVLSFYINLQARSYAGLMGNRQIPLLKRLHGKPWEILLLLDVLRQAKRRRGWARFFFWENLTVLVAFTAINLYCTVDGFIRGSQTGLTQFLTLAVTLGGVIAHFLIFLIVDEVANKNWWDDSVSN